MRKFLTLSVLLLSCFDTTNAATYRADLNDWIARELTPYVAEQLKTQPRFKNESIRFVIIANEELQSSSNQLALNIRDRLRDAMADQPGLRITWQRDRTTSNNSTPIDCTKDQATYYIGIDVAEDRAGLINVAVRALDVVDRSWVAGFSKSWKGYPDSLQRRQLSQVVSDPTFRGERGAPFGEAQFDLLAARLAHELGCSLLRQTSGEYVVAEEQSATGDGDAAELAMLELVGNNLADFRALQFSAHASDANALIEGKAHRVNDNLYQYWVTITPIKAESDLATLSASAYLEISDKYSVATLIPSITVAIDKAEAGFLGALKVVELRDTQQCVTTIGRLTNNRIYGGRYSSSADDCFALEVASQSDAVLFFLNHQLNNGLVRLSGKACNSRADARIARHDATTRFALPVDALMSSAWTAASDWRVNPDKDTYYVVAARDTKAARALSQHIRELPNRCTASVRSGFEGVTLDRWMDQFASLTAHFEKSIDWKVIRVKNMY